MARFGSLDDLKRKEEEDSKATNSYAGGEKSGLAIQNPEDDPLRQQASAGAASGPLPDDHVRVTLYRNGFIVGDGPFRPSSDPLNKKFLDDMLAGNCPAELQQGRTEPVHVAVTDNRAQTYQAPAAPPTPSYTAFSGAGNSLSSNSSAAAAAAGPVQASAGSVAVDDSKPKTKIQVQFHDGSRKAQEFNQDHTVGDLRNFCSQCAGGVPMTIMGGFPPKPLTDDSATLKDAGLLGAAVRVRPA